MSETLGEYSGLKCHHWNEELPLLAEVLKAKRPSIVIETGTMFGGFAAFLADTVKPWGGEVVTFDHLIYPGLQDALLGRENLNFIKADVTQSFADTVIWTVLKEAHDNGRETCFYADGPVARPEFFQFAGMATLAGIHDYGTEVTPAQMEKWATMFGFKPFQHQPFEALQAVKGGYFVSRFWEKYRDAS